MRAACVSSAQGRGLPTPGAMRSLTASHSCDRHPATALSYVVQGSTFEVKWAQDGTSGTYNNASCAEFGLTQVAK